MYSNDKIIENLKKSLFQDTEESFVKLFGPFLLEEDTYNPDLVTIESDIEIKNESDPNFFTEDKPEEEETNDFFDYIDQNISNIPKSSVETKKKKSPRARSSKKSLRTYRSPLRRK